MFWGICSLILTMLFIHKSYSQSFYQNNKYGFNAVVPENWKVFGEIRDDSINKIAIIAWSLPSVYDKTENTFIENAVGIRSYIAASDIENLNDLIKFEFARVGEMLVSKKLIDSSEHITYVIENIQNGIKYKTKITFLFRNNIGYITSFTATPDTYDINVSKFDTFFNGVQFIVPKKQEVKLSKNIILHQNGVYVGLIGQDKNNPENTLACYTFLKFLKNGTVYMISTDSLDIKKVTKQFKLKEKIEKRGFYSIKGSYIKFALSISEASKPPHFNYETDAYAGFIIDENKLFLDIKYDNGDEKGLFFNFEKD